jgi:3-dehydroquinate synthase
MLFAAELGRLAGRTPEAVAARHAAVIEAVGLPTRYPDAVDPLRWRELLTAMGRDKKTRGAMLRFVVLDDLARPGRLESPDPDLLVAARTAIVS